MDASAVPWQSLVHSKVLLPLLPPPVIRGMQHLDPLLEPYVGGPNGSITILFTLLLAWFFLWFILKMTHSGPAVVDEAKAQLESQLRGETDEHVHTTLLLTGSRKSGKTRLFCYLGNGNHQTMTVMSLRSNVAVNDGIRCIDWPGSRPYETAVTDLITAKSGNSSSLRVVLMVDATQPARAAAEALWQLLPLLHTRSSRNNKRTAAAATAVLIACHKQDLPKARNEKRLRIQLRNELERLRSKKQEETNEQTSSSSQSWWPESVQSWEELPFIQLTFHPTTLDSVNGATQLAGWCRTGEFSQSTTSKTSRTEEG